MPLSSERACIFPKINGKKKLFSYAAMKIFLLVIDEKAWSFYPKKIPVPYLLRVELCNTKIQLSLVSYELPAKVSVQSIGIFTKR